MDSRSRAWRERGMEMGGSYHQLRARMFSDSEMAPATVHVGLWISVSCVAWQGYAFSTSKFEGLNNAYRIMESNK